MEFGVVQVKVVGYQGDEYQKRCTSGILRRLITG